MSDGRLPIRIKKIPGGAVLRLATGQRIFIYGREPEVARTANTMTRDQAEALAKDIARALSEAWGATR
jgi:hypothetical protein